MKIKIICIVVVILIAIPMVSTAVEVESIVSGSFVYEGQEYIVSEKFNAENNSIEEQDIDGDGKKETISGFQGLSNDDVRIPVAFLVISKDETVQTISGNSYFTKFELIDIDNDGYSEIVFWSAGGAHYTQVDIYKYSKGQIKSIFSRGSACGIDLKKDDGVYMIRVGQPIWDDPEWNYSKEPLWETWKWTEDRFSRV